MTDSFASFYTRTPACAVVDVDSSLVTTLNDSARLADTLHYLRSTLSLPLDTIHTKRHEITHTHDGVLLRLWARFLGFVGALLGSTYDEPVLKLVGFGEPKRPSKARVAIDEQCTKAKVVPIPSGDEWWHLGRPLVDEILNVLRVMTPSQA